MLLGLANAYVSAINSGIIPEILTSMERIINTEIDRIFDAFMKEYNEQVIGNSNCDVLGFKNEIEFPYARKYPIK